MSIRAKLQSALEALGTTNGTKGSDVSNKGALLHELYVSDQIRAHAKGRYERAKANAVNVLDVDPEQLMGGESIAAASSKEYTVTISASRGATKVDHDKFVTELQKLGVSAKIIQTAYTKARYTEAPRKTWKVSPKA